MSSPACWQASCSPVPSEAAAFMMSAMAPKAAARVVPARLFMARFLRTGKNPFQMSTNFLPPMAMQVVGRMSQAYRELIKVRFVAVFTIFFAIFTIFFAIFTIFCDFYHFFSTHCTQSTTDRARRHLQTHPQLPLPRHKSGN